jgi:hypothetical protein
MTGQDLVACANRAWASADEARYLLDLAWLAIAGRPLVCREVRWQKVQLELPDSWASDDVHGLLGMMDASAAPWE